jgi:hypothetical protein
MHNKLIPIAKQLICEVEAQMEDLENVCTTELGEVIDMIKDLSEAIYYDVVTEAMLDKEELGEEEPETKKIKDTHGENHGYPSYKSYMEAKHKNSDSAILMRELEKYMGDISQDLLEIMKNAAPEEKSYLNKKMNSLISKLG